MRGIEAALKILSENKNSFASEALRKLADREKMKSTDISLASSLIYIVMRRRELWEKLAGTFVKAKEKLPAPIYTAMLVGAGGLMELRRFSEGVLINGIIETLKRDKRNQKYISLVNAVLRKINENGAEMIEKLKKSPSLDDRALIAGVPLWFLSAWIKGWNRAELNEIFEMFASPSYSAIRTQESEKVLALLEEKNIHAFKSDISQAVRLTESILPTNLPGFSEGLCSVQSESSIIAASLVKKFYSGKGLILDMCSGRGVKAGQILEECKNSRLECWELSSGRSQSAAKELERLHVRDRAILKIGDALTTLTPYEEPSFIMLDAPCTGTGTWNRKPESKWQLSWKKFDAITDTQKKLLDRALSLIKSGGYVLYITCSLLRQENENVVAETLANHQDCAEISRMIDFRGDAFRKGKPYGFYIMPCNSWLDGFYVSLIMKR